MPLVKVDHPVDEQDVDINKILVKDDGSLTLEGEIIAAFLDEVDFGPVFDDEEVRSAGLVTTSKAKVVEQHDEFIEAEDGDEKAVEATVESIDPEVMSELVDLDDLRTMFEFYVEHEMDRDSLEGKARFAAASVLVGLDEARPKGTFRIKYNKEPGYTRAKVNQMLGAMLFKSAIQRAAPGTGYRGGDYKKEPAGYGPGTAKGITKWKKYTGRATGKVKGKVLAAAKKAAKKSTKIGKAAGVKKGAAAKLAKGKAKGKAIVASHNEAPSKLTEGAGLAGKMITKMHESSLPPVGAEKK